MSEVCGVSIFVLLIVLLVSLLCRELICWFWKLNEIVELLRSLATAIQGVEDRLSTISTLIDAEITAISEIGEGRKSAAE